jgi:thioesterase domain-containing protein
VPEFEALQEEMEEKEVPLWQLQREKWKVEHEKRVRDQQEEDARRLLMQRQQEELELARKEKAEDIAAVAAMVKTHVQADQDRRLNEILHHSIDRSFDTSNSDSVEEEDMGGADGLSLL